MRRGLTPLALPLLGLGVLVCAGFFVPIDTHVAHAQAKTTTKQAFDKLVSAAVGKEPIKPSAAVDAAIKAGPYKLTQISPEAVRVLICAKMSDAGSWSALVFDWNGNHFFDEKMKDSCDAWQVTVANYNAAIIHYYEAYVSSDKKIPDCPSDIAAVIGVDTTTTMNAITCVPTNTQIERLRTEMEKAFTLVSAAVVSANADATFNDAKKALDDSKCQQRPNLVDSTNDNPTDDFVTQYKKDHDGQPVPTCQQLRDAVNAATAAQKLADAAAKEAAPKGSSCGWTDSWGDCFIGILASVISTIEWLILLVASGILGLANYLLGWATYVTVFQFGNLVGNSAGLLAAWGVMRDVANIVLLFGFIFLGVSTILNLPHSEYTAKKAIPALIIFALLLNFSLFAVEAVIDVSNALATSIYEQATSGGVCNSTADSGVVDTVNSTVDCIFKEGIGGQVMSMSGMTSIYDFSSNNTFGVAGGDDSATVVIYAGLIIFAVITTLVLFAAAIMLIIRAVVLAFLMVTAPIGFAGMAIPPLHEMAKRWWKELISQALFAPVYFLLALLSLKIMSGIIEALTPPSAVGTPAQNLAAVFTLSSDTHQSSNITIVMSFALIIGFMVAALMFAKKSSAMGTNMAMGAAGGFALGALGFVGRNTTGRASLLAANTIAKSRIGRTGTGRLLYGLANKGASSSFDFRQTGGGSALAGQIGSLGTVRKSVQRGMHGIEEDKIKARIEYAKKIKQSDEERQREVQLNADKGKIVGDKAAYEKGRKVEEDGLKQEVADQTQLMAQNGAARGKNTAAVQADLNQAITNNNQADVTKLQNQLNQMLATNAQAMAAEQTALDARKKALADHQTDTKNRVKVYDEEIAHTDAKINGGTHTDLSGQTHTYEGVTLDAAKKSYGRNLQNSSAANWAHSGLSAELKPFGISGHADTEAGREVIRAAGKTGTERAIADLQTAINSGGGGGPTPPHAPAPTGGAGHGGGNP